MTMDMQGHDVGKWDLLIAHPPCTFLSNAGACRLYTENGHINEARLIKGIQAKDFFMEFWYAPIDRICIENPMPSSIYCLPRRSQEIQPFQFGDSFTKKTFLWLKGLPYLVPTKTASERKPYLPSGTGRKLRGASYGVAHTAKQRSKTFPGIAEAMAEQWGALERSSAKHEKKPSHERLRQLLEEDGYQESDEEKAFYDGTHEIWKGGEAE